MSGMTKDLVAAGMDLQPTRHYVGGSMQFLLLLSALLSAMTGGLSSARGEGVRVDHAEAQLIAPSHAAQRAAPAAVRPVQACTPLRVLAGLPRPAAATVPQDAPLATVCLIE